MQLADKTQQIEIEVVVQDMEFRRLLDVIPEPGAVGLSAECISVRIKDLNFAVF